MKRINLFLLLLLSTLSFAQSWQSKDVVRIENTESSFHYTFYDSTTLYIQKQNVSYIVSLPNSNYIQVGYLYEGATSKIMSCTYNTLTQPVLSSNSELVDTLNAWLNEPSSGGGGGSQTLSISNDTLSISNGNSVVLPIGASSLFPNGVKLVLSSRDFQADDKDFVLYCPVPGTIITMPTTNPFSEGDYVGVVMSSPDSYFETYNDGLGGTDKIYPYTQNPSGTTLEQQSSSEVVILRATNTGSVKLLPLSGAVKESVDINGSNFKTLARHNYDKSQNAIPLSGTEVGSPVTGDIETTNGIRIYSNGVDSGSYSGYILDDIVATINAFDNYTGNGSSFVVGSNYTSVSSTNPLSVGLTGIQDFTPNITNLDYTQKIYVGFRGTATLSSGTVTVATSSIKTGYKIYLSVNTPSGTQGFLSAPTGSIVDGTSFVIESSSILDNSTVNWWIAP